MLTKEVENFIASSSIEELTDFLRKSGKEKIQSLCSEVAKCSIDRNSLMNTKANIIKFDYASRTVANEHIQSVIVKDLQNAFTKINSLQDALSKLQDRISGFENKLTYVSKDQHIGIAETINRCVVSVAMLSGFLFILYLLYALVDMLRNRMRRNYLVQR